MTYSTYSWLLCVLNCEFGEDEWYSNGYERPSIVRDFFGQVMEALAAGV